MNASDSMLYDSSVMQALAPAPCSLGRWAASVRAACCRLEGLPCEPDVLAGQILSPGEQSHWISMRAVEKRRHEWLLGRCAAKQAVRLVMEQHLNRRPPWPIN